MYINKTNNRMPVIPSYMYVHITATLTFYEMGVILWFETFEPSKSFCARCTWWYL